MDRSRYELLKKIVILSGIFVQYLFVTGNELNGFDSFLLYISTSIFFFVVLLYADLNLNNLLEKKHFCAFPVTNTYNLLFRIHYLLIRRRYLIFIISYYLTIFFVSYLEFNIRLQYFLWSVLQVVFALTTMIVLDDFIKMRAFSTHLLLIPTLALLSGSFFEDQTELILLKLNPFFTGCALLGNIEINNIYISIVGSIFVFLSLFSSVLFLNQFINNRTYA